jgi:hypothetical protein
VQPPRSSQIFFALSFALAACGSPRADGGACASGSAAPSSSAPAALPSTSRLVDAAELHAQCLLSAIRTPPELTSNHWADVGEVDVKGTKFGWIMVEQLDADVPAVDAEAYVRSAEIGFENRGINASSKLCDAEWNDARNQTVVTVVVRIHADGSKGTYAVFGGLANTALADTSVERVEDVSAADARKAAIAMANEKLGAKLAPIAAPGDWFELAR